MSGRYPLAPMNGVIRVLTVLILPLPLVLAFFASLDPGPQRTVLFGAAAFTLFLWATIWTWFRPGTFVVDPTGITLEFPGRTMHVPDVKSARIIDAAELKSRYGMAARVGAGGLWGGFGWLWTSKRGLVDMYISRTDRFVLVERVNGRELLITPDRAEEFVSAVRGGAAMLHP